MAKLNLKYRLKGIDELKGKLNNIIKEVDVLNKMVSELQLTELEIVIDNETKDLPKLQE